MVSLDLFVGSKSCKKDSSNHTTYFGDDPHSWWWFLLLLLYFYVLLCAHNIALKHDNMLGTFGWLP